jgi:hypothetical protein
LIQKHPPFESDDALKLFLQALSFQAFTYPEMVCVPDSLGMVPIPVIPATHSDPFRPPIPNHSGRLFRGIPATPSERSDAGVEIYLTERSGRVKL